MDADRRIYLDNAATSWPKPDAVYQAVDRYQREIGAPAGRGAYAEAVLVGRTIERTRQLALELVGGVGEYHAIFTPNCTAALNLAIHGSLRPGDHVVTTVVEHNSVLRPLRAEQAQRGVEVSYVDCDAAGIVDPAAVRKALRPATRLIAVSHASNVTGAIQPVEAIGAIARQHGALLLVDAAQSLGHLPVDLSTIAADFVAGAGHKGLLAPLGVGLLFLRNDAADKLTPILQGGTGTSSQLDAQPDELPERFESGNLDVPALFGLAAGLEFIRERGVTHLAEHAGKLTQQLLDGLSALEDVRVYGPPTSTGRVGVVSFNVEGYDPQEIAAGLQALGRIQVRAGLHCAGRMHERLGTLSSGGSVRISFGPFNERGDVELLLRLVGQVSTAAKSS